MSDENSHDECALQAFAPFFSVPSPVYGALHLASLASGVDVGRVALGVLALCHRLYESKEVERGVAARMLGGDAVLAQFVDVGALLEHGNHVTTLVSQKHARLRETRRSAARKRWAELKNSTSKPARKKRTGEQENTRTLERENRREQHALQVHAEAVHVHALASAEADAPAQGLDAGQETDSTRPQLTLAPSAIPERSAFKEAQWAVCEEFASLRAGGYKWQGAKDSTALRGLLEGGATVAELRERWRRALQLEKWPACSTVAELAAKWNHLARVEIKHKTGTSNVF